MVFERIFIFIITVLAGLAVMVYTEKVVRLIGKNELAERYLGAGGTYSMWKLIGMITIFVGLLILMGKVNLPGV
jgi:hypothetical protein